MIEGIEIIAGIIAFAIINLGLIWIVYGYPVRALIKDLENDNLRLKIKLKELIERGKKNEN